MKKTLAIFAVILCIFGTTTVFATNIKTTKSTNNTVTNNLLNEADTTVSQLVEIKDKEKTTLEDYKESYGSETYGLTAYILNKVQVYSIPFCFVGIAVSAIYQYVLGIRKLDTRDKGFGIMISIVTIFIIAQVLPLIFAIVVKGWRG